MSQEKGKGRSLTRHEFDAVIRRAAELASSDPEAGEGELTEAEVFRIAREVGLGDRHVRMALSEVHSGTHEPSFMDRIFGPTVLHATRVVPGTPKDLARTLDDFFAGTQLLQTVRRAPNLLQYRPAQDWASQIARAASFTSRKYYVASAKSVEAHLNAVDEDSTLVELVVDPGTRGDSIAGASVGGGTAGLLTGLGAGAVLVSSGAVIALSAGMGVVVGGAVLGGIAYATGASHKKKLQEVQSELEGLLDRLENRESLEPPPASWRSWVKRQFHGMARDFDSAQARASRDLDDLNDEFER
ncbi:MAG TPA: hypothetical protein VLA36_07025 [Longimicrobiales bacterium]|nr:hypothetical protein [Longimicrobiales bacterium]